MRTLSAIVWLCATLLLYIDYRHRKAGDRRRLSLRAARISLTVAILAGWAVAAQARPSSYPPATPFVGDRYGTAQPNTAKHAPMVRQRSLRDGLRREITRAVGRPSAWCGWWLGQHLGMPSRHLWLARNWKSVGSHAGGPGVGVVVVWPHHVGIITGKKGGQWVVKSGNDGHAVRERPRSVAGAIAFRRVS
jgi:hypothetical protein